MNIIEGVDLKQHSTMRLGGKAAYFAEVTHENQLPELVDWARTNSKPILMIGQGSNIIWRDEGFGGLLLANKITGREILSQDKSGTRVKLSAGNVWDEDVAWSVEQGLSGIEKLSLIPGTTGATPVQNVGAYGAEIAETLVEVRAYDLVNQTFVNISGDDCMFSYRSSRFKTKDRHLFLIVSVTLQLSFAKPAPPFYEALQRHLDINGVTDYSIENIREAVIEIRSSKLPDPARVANNGSFFTNPQIEKADFIKLQEKFPDIKSWPTKAGKQKLAAGWLIQKAGFAESHDQETGMATWSKQSLVLVNEHAKSTADLEKFKDKIVSKVKEKFGVTLVQEPELLP